MRRNTVRNLGRVPRAALAALFVLLLAVPASAAGYPRRIAVAPFVSLTKEDIGSTVSVLPRLLASRLMALAGADVLLLPAGGKSPEEAARESAYPLLLQGTVSKLGKGYSIDTTVTDLATGKSAGAFFAAAATEDDIIAQLGMMSGEIAEKLFDVQGAVRAVSPAPVLAAPVVAPPQTIGGIPAAAPPQAIGGVPVAATASQAPAAAPPAAAGPVTLAGGWSPSSIKRVGQSDKIADELFGVVTIERDAEGNDLVAAYGKTALYLYRVKGTEIVPFTRVSRSLEHHFLNVDAVDLDGDGEKEILVTDLINETVESFVLKKKGGIYEEAAEKIRYYLVVLPDWNGKPTVVGQYQGIDTPFYGKIVTLRWDGKGFVAGEPLPHNTDILPLSAGVVGLSAARFGKEWRLIYTDENSYLRVVDAGGKSLYKSRIRYGSLMDYFEWGPFIQLEGRRKQYPLRKGVRIAPGGGETPLVLIPEIKKGILDVTAGSYDSTRLTLLQWDGGDFLEKAGTQGTSQFLSGADYLSLSGFSKGDKIVASVIEQTGVLLKDKISRLLLFQVE
jgi:hypothetical protein